MLIRKFFIIPIFVLFINSFANAQAVTDGKAYSCVCTTSSFRAYVKVAVLELATGEYSILRDADRIFSDNERVINWGDKEKCQQEIPNYDECRVFGNK